MWGQSSLIVVLRQAYPHSVLPGEVVGGAWMPFRRIFVVAQTPAARTSPP